MKTIIKRAGLYSCTDREGENGYAQMNTSDHGPIP